MKTYNNIYKLVSCYIFLIFLFISCNDELQVENPNQPTPESAASENGIIALAQGGVYISGFNGLDAKYNDGVPGRFVAGCIGIHELLGDVIGEEAANWFGNQIACPDEVVLDDGSIVKNPQSPSTQIALVRAVNDVANLGGNFTFQEWAYMYSLNNVCNNLLKIVTNVEFDVDDDIKTKTIQAWAYWWKGYAYSRIGSIYYAGLINDEPNVATNVFVTKEKILEEATSNFDKAVVLLKSLSDGGSYQSIMGKIIPDFIQAGVGQVPSPAAWVRNINTYKARNILVNTSTATMTSSQWNSILSLVNDGIKSDDKIFIGRSNANAEIWNTETGYPAAKTASVRPGTNTYKLSERIVQDFKETDKRKANNFKQDVAWIGNSDRGIIFNTRYALVDGGNGIPGVYVIVNRAPEKQEIYISTSYEENELMKAEALINTGKIEDGLVIIDAIRVSQGAGLPATKGLGLSLTQAKEELRSERRVALVFRGLSFYDARRWGVSEKGNARTNAVVVDGKGKVNTKATIRYNFLDYWDVPDNEIKYNIPATSSAPVKNPKQ